MPRDPRQAIQEVETTVWVGKRGVEAASGELADQLADRAHVKVKFLRAARGSADTETVAAELAALVDAEVVATRGHTAVFA